MIWSIWLKLVENGGRTCRKGSHHGASFLRETADWVIAGRKGRKLGSNGREVLEALGKRRRQGSGFGGVLEPFSRSL